MVRQKSQGWWGVSVIAVVVIMLLSVAMYYSGFLGNVSVVGGVVTSERNTAQCDDSDSEADTEGSTNIWLGGSTRMRTREWATYEWEPWATRGTDNCRSVPGGETRLSEAYCTTFLNTFSYPQSREVLATTRNVDCRYGCITDTDGLASCRLPPCTDSDASLSPGRRASTRGTTTGIIPSEALGFPPSNEPTCEQGFSTTPCSWPPPPPPPDTLQVSRTYTDSCASSTRLIEYSCAGYGGPPPRRGGPANQAVVRAEFSCPPTEVCSEGMCVASAASLIVPVQPSEIQPATRSSKPYAKPPPPPSISPACTPSSEICDGQDNDCDSTIDEGCDDDNDNYCDAVIALSGTPPTCTAGGGDCQDAAADGLAINPGATEVCGNTVDENCDTLVDSCPAAEPAAAEASPPPPASPSCTDSDGANARNVPGTATSTDALAQGPTRTSPEIAGTPVDGGLYEYRDSCSADGRTLYQYSCFGADVRQYEFACPPRTGTGYGFCITDATGSYCPSCATNPGAAGCPSS